MLPTEDGITPVNLFSCKNKAFKFVSFPIEDGIFPINKLDLRSSSVRLTRFDIRVGMLPPIELHIARAIIIGLRGLLWS